MSLQVGLREQTTEKVLLVCQSKSNGGIRIDWWPSVEEAEQHDMIVLEVREKITLPARHTPKDPFYKKLGLFLGKGGAQDELLKRNAFDRKEWFHKGDE